MSRQGEMLKKIVIKGIDARKFHECVISEHKALNAKRFSYDLSFDDNEVTFDVSAMDSTAMKAAESSIAKLEKIFRKMKNISCGENV